LTLVLAPYTLESFHGRQTESNARQEYPNVTKKEIVRQISEKIGMTQLRTKEIVQLTFDAILETLLEDKRIELRNFGVFEVKQRKARKARNPKTGERVDVPSKNVVTFKPGKEMEERVLRLTGVAPSHSKQELVGAGTGDHSSKSGRNRK
jgi:nucleoid DNA-binding protein